jgi:hypothetical protein
MVSYLQGVLVNPLMVSRFLTQYTYVPGAVGNAGAVVLQLLPKLSQYCTLLPAGILAGSIVPAIVAGLLGSPIINVPSIGVGAGGNIVIVSYTQGLLVKPVMVSIDLIQYTYTPGWVGNAGAVVVQLLPKLSQYCTLLPDGILAGSIVPDISVGLPGLPLVNVPSIGVGAAGGTAPGGSIFTVSYLHGSLINPLAVSIALMQYT